MATLVCFHAHPDDESMATAGVMAKAVAEGHRVVLVVATRGEHGEVADGFLAEGEALGTRREQETLAAAAALGAVRVEFLGYLDSGMVDTDTNALPGSFWGADVDEAAGRLAAILSEERAEVLTIYDDHGGYGHPDHIQVHRVGVRAAAMAGTPRVYQSTMNRTRLQALMRASTVEVPEGLERPDPVDFDTFGTPQELITCEVDVTAWVDRKRAAMRAHRSQITDDHFLLVMSDDAFAAAFGIESFIRDGQGPGLTETTLL